MNSTQHPASKPSSVSAPKTDFSVPSTEQPKPRSIPSPASLPIQGAVSSVPKSDPLASLRPGDEQVPRVVAGYDGSQHCVSTLEAAATEAKRRGVPLDIVAVPGHLHEFDLARVVQHRTVQEEKDQTERLLNAVAVDTRSAFPGLDVRMHLLDPHASRGLAEQMTGCELLVVGARGAMAKRAFSMGSISRDLAHGTRCPVLVVPERWTVAEDAPGPVVAAVDGRDLSASVTKVAAREALRRDGRLTLLHCVCPGTGETAESARERGVQVCLQLQAEVASTPGLTVDFEVTTAHPREAVKRQRTPLMVFGSHGLMALAGLGLQVVSRDILDAVRCPALVVTPTVDSTCLDL